MNRARIKEQSKQVAEYMKKPQKYQVLWICPHCGNSHAWWWEDEFEAFWEGETHMVCDRCDERVKCIGDGHGFYTAVKEKESTTLEKRIAELEDLNADIHESVRELESEVNRLLESNKLAFDAINSLAKRLADLERPSTPEATPRKDPLSFLDLIHGERPPFHERFREGCGFTEETLPGEDIAKMLRFIAVEVECMTERDMGGSFTISNLKVGERLRALAYEAEWSDEDPFNPALAEDGN